MSSPLGVVAEPIFGCVEPRLFTPPLRELTPATSYGFAVIAFARDVLFEPLDPWEEFAVIHGGELLPDGRPRFRQVLLLVARQNGKTHVVKVLELFWLYVERWPLILGTSTNLDYARESWEKAVQDAEMNDALRALTANVRRANGEQTLTTIDRCRSKIAAANRKGGRSLTVDRLKCDELREHHDWSSYNAAYNAMNARPYAQAWFLSNAGDDLSVVLNALRDLALAETDPRLGIMEYSAPDGCDVMDVDGWRQANPNLGRRLDVDTIRSAALRAQEHGGAEEAGFRTEVLCQRVKSLDAAVDPRGWNDGGVDGSLDAARGRVALGLDGSPDGLHWTLVAAAVVRPGVIRGEVVAAWSGIGASQSLRADLPGWLERIKPRAFGWLPGGPAAALLAELGKPQRAPGAPAATVRPPMLPRGVSSTEIVGDTSAVCMGFAEQVASGAIEHPKGDQLLDAHVLGAEKLRSGDRWRFSRKGGHCDAAYAFAAAVHVARTLPPPASSKLHLSSTVRAELARSNKNG